MTTETSNARGEVVAWIRVRPDGSPDWAEDCIADDEHFLNPAMEADGYRLRPLIYADTAPPPAAARGDVRGLVARVAQLREAIESEPDHCFGANVIGGRAYGVRENLLCIVGLIEAALAAEGVQAGEVEFDRLLDSADRSDAALQAFNATLIPDLRVPNTLTFRLAMTEAIASALSQQPEARGVVDVTDEMVERGVSEYRRMGFVYDVKQGIRKILTAALTGERNG